MVNLNILFYTDHQSMLLPNSNHGITILESLLKNRKPFFVDTLDVKLINRFEVPQKPNKLTKDLLDQYDEIWFFGKYQAKVNGQFRKPYGGPENELDRDEIVALGKWMEKGGVLITGDHSQINLPLDGTNKAKIYCRGRALGLHIPRARRLRAWEDAPDLYEKSFNTLVKFMGREPAKDFELQEDEMPQTIDLTLFGLDGSPHPIFQGKRKTIKIFPDHMHEGAVRVLTKEDDLNDLKELIGEEWPMLDGKLHEPKIVAHGLDNRTNPPQRLGVVAVYDGDPVKRGRIIADSSWHHYVNVNLKNFGDSGEDSDLDLMAQFYSNLAVWLAPLDKRKEMSHAMFNWLAEHPDIEEEIGSHVTRIGEAGSYYLSQVATGCEVNELIQAAFPNAPGADSEPLLFPSKSLRLADLPSQELVLGSVINKFQRRAFTVVPLETSDAEPDPILKMTDDDLAAQGLEEALRLHTEKANTVPDVARRNLRAYRNAITRDEG